MTKEALSRRNALAGAATVGIGLPLLAACGGDSDETATDSPSAGGSASGSPSEEASAGTALGAAADVPVGGGVIFKDQKVVVTQPAEGEFKGFSAICTHQGCPVGSVETGPATKPLGSVAVKVKGGEITVA